MAHPNSSSWPTTTALLGDDSGAVVAPLLRAFGLVALAVSEVPCTDSPRAAGAMDTPSAIRFTMPG